MLTSRCCYLTVQKNILLSTLPKLFLNTNDYHLAYHRHQPFFQRAMKGLLQDLPGVIVYLDNVLVTSPNKEEHLKNLDKVMDRLKSAGVTLKQPKCIFLAPVEQKYSQIEKRGVSHNICSKKFHQYLYAWPFAIYSDHEPLKYLFNESRQIPVIASSRIQRWALTSGAYQYSIQHRPGKK